MMAEMMEGFMIYPEMFVVIGCIVGLLLILIGGMSGGSGRR